jgi:hypothetical protein
MKGRRRGLLMCGLAAALVYVVTDVIAALAYPGYSIRDQAVSELFAIGAPTAWMVVPLFSLASLLLVAFAAGIWFSASGRRAVQVIAAMFALSAFNALLLWNAFPMHMRGAERTLTDQMHLVLSADPFVILTVAGAVVAFRGRFRLYSLATIAMVLAPAAFAFQFAPALDAGLATPWLGLAERFAQYGYEVWQVVLALVLISDTDRRAA